MARPPLIDLNALKAGLPDGVRIMAMARPARPAGERSAVINAAKPGRSARSEAARIAAKASKAHLAEEAIEDELERALAEARQAFDPGPYLAIAQLSDIAGSFAKHRSERFIARGCCQIPNDAWSAETRTIAKAVETQLSRRYRTFLS